MAFVSLLLDAKVQSQFPIYVVLTIRSDFLGECAKFPGLPEAINEGQYLIPRLTRDERRAAIAGGAKMSPVLLTQLVNDVGDNPDQLSILQHALNRTWACWESEANRQALIDLLHYNKIGTMSHALDWHAEEAYHELRDKRQQKICKKIFQALTDQSDDPRGVRRPTKFCVLCDIAQATPEEVAAVIDFFREPSRSFLMPPLPQKMAPDDVVDISHESFMRCGSSKLNAADILCRRPLLWTVVLCMAWSPSAGNCRESSLVAKSLTLGMYDVLTRDRGTGNANAAGTAQPASEQKPAGGGTKAAVPSVQAVQ